MVAGNGNEQGPAILLDVSGAEDRRFSPYCWRAKLALAHKGVEFRTVPLTYTDIQALPDAVKAVPILEHGGARISDSFRIAEYLENLPGPSLFPGGRAAARFMEGYVNTAINPLIMRMIVLDVLAGLDPVDHDYFRESRTKRFGAPLEEIVATRGDTLPAFRKALAPVRHALANGPWLSGEAPAYPDYVLAGTLMWARVASPLELLEPGDTVAGWFGRVLDLFDGFGRTAAKAAA
jgi:glutathione S-transferase